MQNCLTSTPCTFKTVNSVYSVHPIFYSYLQPNKSAFYFQLWLLTKEGKDFLKKDWKSDVSEVSTTTTLPKLSTVLANSEVYTFSTTTPLPKLNTLLTSSAVSRVSPALHQLEAEMEEEYCFEVISL